MEDRKMLFIPENKKKIEKIKKKYKNPELSDETANKIAQLQVVDKALSVASAAAGLTTVIDLLVPDPVVGLDEAALVAITSALKFAQSQVKSHITDLANEGNTEVNVDEVNKLSGQLINAAKAVKKSRTK